VNPPNPFNQSILEVNFMPEKFSTLEVAMLRNDLLHNGLDCFQVAETIKMFVARRGYGMSAEMARNVTSQLESADYNAECLHQQLESLALVM
jgi:hypothetical protein